VVLAQQPGSCAQGHYQQDADVQAGYGQKMGCSGAAEVLNYISGQLAAQTQ
jgi:hypothetical protein